MLGTQGTETQLLSWGADTLVWLGERSFMGTTVLPHGER